MKHVGPKNSKAARSVVSALLQPATKFSNASVLGALAIASLWPMSEALAQQCTPTGTNQTCSNSIFITGVQAGIDCELIVVVRIIRRGIRREAARGPVLEALVDRQDDQPAGAAEPALHQDAGEVGLGPRAIALVIVEDLLDRPRDLHRQFPQEFNLPEAAPVIAGRGYSFKPGSRNKLATGIRADINSEPHAEISQVKSRSFPDGPDLDCPSLDGAGRDTGNRPIA